jgi:hypothetical protein
MTKRTIREFHEAGHAVIGRVLGIPVSYINMLGDGEVLATSATHLARDADKAAQLAAIAKDVIACCAGPMAQHRHHPQRNRRPVEWDGDRETASALAYRAALIESGIDFRQLNPNDLAPPLNADQTAFFEEFLQSGNDKALKLVDQHWPAIERVAKALLVRPILNSADLDELISSGA